MVFDYFFKTNFGNTPPSFKLAYKSIFIDQSAYIFIFIESFFF
ncbi:MAG: hypothetical protein ACKPKO_58975 [Candidatus Fonsibacter sp.]